MSCVHCQTDFEPLLSHTEHHNGYFSSGHVAAVRYSNSARWRASGSDVSVGWHSASFLWSWSKCAWMLCFYRDGVALGNQSTGHLVHLSCIYVIFSGDISALAYRHVMSVDIPESRQMALESVTTEMLTNTWRKSSINWIYAVPSVNVTLSSNNIIIFWFIVITMSHL